MACGFRNSAGTDLDDLFYIDNSNGGAIGFQMSNGVDLGNRFTNKSTLGYNLGYKNPAGTDIGFLRGKLTPPTGGGIYFKKLQAKHTTDKYQSGTDSEGRSDYRYSYYVSAVCEVGVNINVPVTSARLILTAYAYMGWSGSYSAGFWPNNSTLYSTSTNGYYFGGNRTYYDGPISGNKFVFSYVGNTGRFYHTNVEWTARIILSNAAGSSEYSAQLFLRYDEGAYN